MNSSSICRLLLAVVLVLIACDKANISGPGPTSPPPIDDPDPGPDPDPEPRPPRVDQPVDLWDVEGVTAFGAALLSEAELTALVYHAQLYGKNMLRVGAQTDGWCGTGQAVFGVYGQDLLGDACDPMATVGSEKWRENLFRLMDVTARTGISLQLIPTFTHKNLSFDRNMQITRLVVAVQQAGSPDDPRPYEHIVWEAVNEVIHPITSDSLRGNVVELLRYLKQATGLPVGTDHPGEYSPSEDRWRGNYPADWLPWVDYVAFHPPRYRECRDVRPDFWELRRAVRNYSRPVWIDEPTAFISDMYKSIYGVGDRNGHYALCGGGTEEARKRYISNYRWDVLNAGAMWTTHSAWGFECRAPGWLPQ